MKETTKKNLPLIIGLAIPALMIAAVTLAIYLPRGLAPKPIYSFIYTGNDNGPYDLSYYYTISNGHLVQNQLNTPNGYPPLKSSVEPQLYVYDAASGKSSSVTYGQAQNFTLDQSAASPDGYQVVTGSSISGFPLFFGNSSNNTRYLKGHGTSFPLNLDYPVGDYYYNFRFLGWIIK